MRRIHTVFLTILMTFAGITAFATGPVAKQLAGPPAEFEMMRAMEPGEVGIRSKSAMLPVFLEQQVDGTWTWNGQVVVENSQRFNMVVFGGQAMGWDLDMKRQGMKRPMPVNEMFYEVRESEYGLGDNKVPVTLYGFEEMAEGTWQIRVKTTAPRTKVNPQGPDGYIMFGSENPWRLYAHHTQREFWVGNEIGMATYGFDQRLTEDLSTPMPLNMIEEAVMRVTAPSGEVTLYKMFDDGAHADAGEADGVYGTTFVPLETGQYNSQIIATGHTPDGKAFIRTAEHSFPVIAPDLELASDLLTARVSSDTRLTVGIPVDLYDGAVGRYRTIGEVWGTNAEGVAVPVSWIGGITEVSNGALELGLDARWIANAGAEAPFEMRNLRIETLDGYVPVATAPSMELAIDRLPAEARRTKTITEDMMMGVRPEMKQTKRAGRLLLVHGYCSGNVWGSETNHFTNETVFSDFNQNRSHDSFANQILSQGSPYSSYGIVAHSQGGAASLHLYTYYWSGLDNASGGRLVQSVGTPYQGTALAGNLAAIGDVFGAGCGTNNDLTYSGASSWLSGIPTWARNAINYYTTSFTDKWWRYDYCHLATDLFLNDPEDGTTEKSYGQLPSGVNRGHKTGWCHTNSMRDPGQCTDGGRNDSMNSNAAN